MTVNGRGYEVWTVAMLKGGVRKTTTAWFLASALAKFGFTPACLDADPGTQGVTDWATRIVVETGAVDALPFDVAQWTARYGLLVPFIQQQQATHLNSHILVDVGSEVPEVVRQAAAWSTLAILPVGAEQAELARLSATSDLVKDAGVLVPQIVVLTRVPQPGKGAAKAVRAMLEQEGYRVAATEIPHNRDVYAHPFGMLLADLGAYADLAQELAEDRNQR
jgi:cellulose biosynthesis protein BcsQ